MTSNNMSEFECWTKLYGWVYGDRGIWMEYGGVEREFYEIPKEEA